MKYKVRAAAARDLSPRPGFRDIKRVAVVASASGSGKTTLARTLAERLGGTFVELDALRHGPNWRIATTERLRSVAEVAAFP